MRRMAQIKSAIEGWHDIASKCTNLIDLVDLAIEESDTSFEVESVAEVAEIERLIEEMEFQETLGGKYDS